MCLREVLKGTNHFVDLQSPPASEVQCKDWLRQWPHIPWGHLEALCTMHSLLLQCESSMYLKHTPKEVPVPLIKWLVLWFMWPRDCKLESSLGKGSFQRVTWPRLGYAGMTQSSTFRFRTPGVTPTTTPTPSLPPTAGISGRNGYTPIHAMNQNGQLCINPNSGENTMTATRSHLLSLVQVPNSGCNSNIE